MSPGMLYTKKIFFIFFSNMTLEKKNHNFFNIFIRAPRMHEKFS